MLTMLVTGLKENQPVETVNNQLDPQQLREP